MLVYMLNVHRRNHQKIYGPGAFFDLNQDGQQANLLLDIRPQQECLVVSYSEAKGQRKDPEVEFSTYLFERAELLESEDAGVFCRVFFGSIKSSLTMSKSTAIKMPIYAPFFSKIGHFKQRSVVKGLVDPH